MTVDSLFLQFFSEGTGTEAESPSVEEAGEITAEEEFETLIKGKYADAFSKRTQGIIDKRFAKMKGFERTAKAVSPLLEELTARFPDIDKSDTEGLISAFMGSLNGDGEEKTEAAEDEKTDTGILKAAEAAAREKAVGNLARYLSEESNKLREIYPSFDLRREIDSSPEFLTLLEAGVSLRRAFETVNLENILGSALRYAVMKAGRNAADAIKSNVRVSENSIAERASSVKRTDVNSLTEKEIHKILSQVGKGAKISF